MNAMAGTVYLIGAGPGDPGLVTLRGAACIEMADVIVYDYLAAPALLDHARSSAERIYVGKKGGNHTLTQDEINRLLVEKAKTGAAVARLKGGDPFIFGRGGEEAEFLYAHDIPFEVVPGVTSVIAAPAYAGIPLTHRNMTATVAFVTGHEDPEKAESNIDWAALARGVGTLVFVMGVKNLPVITKNLLDHGRNPETPAALIRWGTVADQETVVGRLDDIEQKAAHMTPPAVIVIGEVVGLRKHLAWFEHRPLFGKRIVVTRSRAQASDLVSALEHRGAACIQVPVITIVPPADPAPLEEAAGRLDHYDWIVFTSVNGVSRFFDHLTQSGRDVRALHRIQTASIGPATAARLREFGLNSDIIPESYRAESVVEAFSAVPMSGKRVLLPRAMEARPVLPRELSRMGAVVDEVPVYETRAAGEEKATLLTALAERRVDMVTFTSSSTVKNFADLLPPETEKRQELLRDVAIACIGPITADTARSMGFAVTFTAEVYTIPGLVSAVWRYYANAVTDSAVPGG